MHSRLTITAFILITFPELAAAHLVSTRFGEFYSGLLHPLISMNHVVPWIALGLLGGQQHPPVTRYVLLIFPLTVCLGAAIGSVLPPASTISIINLLSFCLLGLLVVIAKPLNGYLFLALSAVFGLTHGYANGAQDLGAGDLLLYIPGVLLAAYLIITLLTAGAQVINQWDWGKIAIRAVGSWILAIGLLYSGMLIHQSFNV